MAVMNLKTFLAQMIHDLPWELSPTIQEVFVKAGASVAFSTVNGSHNKISWAF